MALQGKPLAAYVATWLPANNFIDIDQCNLLSYRNGASHGAAVALCYKKGAMAIKKTIAIIASTNEKATAIVNNLSIENCRLLLLSKYANQFSELSTAILSAQPNIELDVIDCMRDGCWEADIIILDISGDEQQEVVELIKEVATQKIVINFSENENNELQALLKYSKVVKVFNAINSPALSFWGKDQDAVLEASGIFKNSKQNKEAIKLSNY